jgi:hypothetical protein
MTIRLQELRKRLIAGVRRLDILKQVEGLHSIHAEVVGGTPRIVLQRDGMPPDDGASSPLEMPFAAGLDDPALELPADFLWQVCPPAKIFDGAPPIEEGPPSKTDGILRPGMRVPKGTMDGYGSLGWLFRSSEAVHFVSNWHILCGNGNESTGDEVVHVNDGAIRVVGQIRTFVEVHPCTIEDGEEHWNTHDCAVARLNADSKVSFGSVDVDGRTFAYPASILDPDDAVVGEEYYRIGASTESICRLVGLGVIMLTPSDPPYQVGKRYTFKNQLIFRTDDGSPAAEGGDSGSVFVRASDGAVAAVQFAVGGNNLRDGYASPLAQFSWMVGESADDGPELTGDPFQKPPWAI